MGRRLEGESVFLYPGPGLETLSKEARHEMKGKELG
jgi:hypothetical protein